MGPGTDHVYVSVSKPKGKESYDDWAFAAQNFLILERLSKCIEESDATTEDISPNPGEITEDAKARTKSILTIDLKLYVHIKNSTNARDLWMQRQEPNQF
ncbi:hypothetical protein QE152_g7854 [Popillia japonica]|uniref:Uncharacterized protein n=1 Tax=Popillia japonica TaxID=7064 RepID=A0AAW1MDR8_POPJA